MVKVEKNNSHKIESHESLLNILFYTINKLLPSKEGKIPEGHSNSSIENYLTTLWLKRKRHTDIQKYTKHTQDNKD